MKQLILMLVFVLGTFACNREDTTKYVDRECKKPSDIPDTLCSGAKVQWDCSWQGSYKGGNVYIKYKDCGCAEYVGRKITQYSGESK